MNVKIMKKIIEEILYLNWKLLQKEKAGRNLPPFNKHLGLSLRIAAIIYIILLFIIGAFFNDFFTDIIAKIFYSSRIKYLIIYTLAFLPFIIFFFKYYVRHEQEFRERLKKEKQYIKEFKERLNKDSKTDKFEENIPKEEYCIDCKKSFSKVKRFENTNLCEKCFNKELSDDSKSNENQRQVFH